MMCSRHLCAFGQVSHIFNAYFLPKSIRLSWSCLLFSVCTVPSTTTILQGYCFISLMINMINNISAQQQRVKH